MEEAGLKFTLPFCTTTLETIYKVNVYKEKSLIK